MKLPLSVSSDSKEPIYHQIENQIKSLIISGQLLPGTLLPSIRALSADLACSVITTRRAYQNLENSGFIQTMQGKGTFVNEMDRKTQDDTKIEIAISALEKAIEQALMIGCSLEQIRNIIEQILKEREGKRDE